MGVDVAHQVLLSLPVPQSSVYAMPLYDSDVAVSSSKVGC